MAIQENSLNGMPGTGGLYLQWMEEVMKAVEQQVDCKGTQGCAWRRALLQGCTWPQICINSP